MRRECTETETIQKMCMKQKKLSPGPVGRWKEAEKKGGRGNGKNMEQVKPAGSMEEEEKEVGTGR